MKDFFHTWFELLFWAISLVSIWFINPLDYGFSFCLFKLAGVPWCPGCGLAHAMSYALHGDVVASFRQHSFGIAAVLIIIHRIVVLFKMHFITSKRLYNGV